VIETWTVRHDRDGARTGIIVGRLQDSGARFLARADDDDRGLLELLTSGEPAGQPVRVRPASGLTIATIRPAARAASSAAGG
jgi:acetyl-CoA C-acetyltransferase